MLARGVMVISNCSASRLSLARTVAAHRRGTFHVLYCWLTDPKSPRKYSSAVFMVAPGLTVKDRLRVLQPGEPGNYYDSFSLCPSEALRHKLNQADGLGLSFQVDQSLSRNARFGPCFECCSVLMAR